VWRWLGTRPIKQFAHSYMSAFPAVDAVVSQCLSGLEDDLRSYIQQVLEDMTPNERRVAAKIAEVVVPFLVDADFADEAAANSICQSMSVMFGGSGSLSTKSHAQPEEEEEAPRLLSAPVRIQSSAVAKSIEVHHSYGGNADAASASIDAEGGAGKGGLRGVALRTAERARRVDRAQAAAEEALRMEMAAARLAAIAASRKSGRQSAAGVSIDRFCLPHPSGTGELLSDAQLVLSPGRRYGLIGKNGTSPPLHIDTGVY
jgi:hypothetical protein